ncbi:MAG TPA: extracellular solute-binding protein [Candidatus Acidoferrum sp.]|nr:extracellular solute-binding protein [Candidatus Acidoferrum sp.]
MRRLTTFALLFLALSLAACRRSTPETVTLTYLRLGWSQPDELPTAEPLNQQFTRETRIQLKPLPVPENTLDQLDLTRKLLRRANSGPDVMGLDLIWTGVLAKDLLGLRSFLAPEIALLKPQLMPSYTVDGQVVALPYTVQVGVLEYRSDLLREYGYDHPPKTWDELETMAARIQAGERAKGNKNFWGYVWQGAAAEALTCNALEWQAAEGGGRVIENDRTISVNNPAAIRSWQRAQKWIGWISPPSVLEFHEVDSMNSFDAGSTAFNRIWGATTISPNEPYGPLHWRGSLPEGKTGYASIPGGPGGRAGTLGGSGLAISRRSTHQQEAIQLVRFLIRAQVRFEEKNAAKQPGQPEVYDRPSIAQPLARTQPTGQQTSGTVARPSSVSGETYEDVTKAYIAAVHSVLTGHIPAPQAAADLQAQLVKITGYGTGPPKPGN